AVLREVIARAPAAEAGTEDLDATGLFLERLKDLRATQQRFVLRILAIASVIDGRLTRAERGLLVEARRAAGTTSDLSAVERLRVAFLEGQPLDRQRIETLS